MNTEQLQQAAEEFAKKIPGLDNFAYNNAVDDFKAGAEWQSGQPTVEYTTDEVWKIYSQDENFATKSYSQFAKENDWVMIKKGAPTNSEDSTNSKSEDELKSEKLYHWVNVKERLPIGDKWVHTNCGLIWFWQGKFHKDSISYQELNIIEWLEEISNPTPTEIEQTWEQRLQQERLKKRLK